MIDKQFITNLQHVFDSDKRMSILGMGNPLIAKDSFGIYMAMALQGKCSNWQVLNCETVPENFLGKVIKYHPERIVFVDVVADQAGCTDQLFILNKTDFIDKTFGTHKVGLTQLADFILQQINTEIMLVGYNLEILPKNLDYEEYYENYAVEFVQKILQ